MQRVHQNPVVEARPQVVLDVRQARREGRRRRRGVRLQRLGSVVAGSAVTGSAVTRCAVAWSAVTRSAVAWSTVTRSVVAWSAVTRSVVARFLEFILGFH
jgi:hypothetical protein